ncbi:hypothetical protein EDB80DRAFT_756495 [Ilyonectria destructans]|nr:hypothetical protein EDB80DRAFT_756495 [Ilyonectria destructans]
MAKKITTAKRRRAEENGYNDSDDDIDDSPVLRIIEPCTDKKYETQLELWDDLSNTIQLKHYLTLKNYMYLKYQLWQEDGHKYKYKEYQVIITDKRRLTYILYKDVLNQLLIVNPILFIISIFLAAGAVKHYQTVKHYWILNWADYVLEKPVFSEISVDSPKDKIQIETGFSSQLIGLLLQAGIQHPITVHSMQRNSYLKDELTKFAAHTNRVTLQRDYLSSITNIDSQACFLKLPTCSDFTENFHSITVKRNPELFLSLPVKVQDDLRQTEDYTDIEGKISSRSKFSRLHHIMPERD